MLRESVFDELIDWRRIAKEEQKTKRFCQQCGQLVTPKLREHKYYQNFYSCPECGEDLFKKVTVKGLSSRGYSSSRYRRR